MVCTARAETSTVRLRASGKSEKLQLLLMSGWAESSGTSCTVTRSPDKDELCSVVYFRGVRVAPPLLLLVVAGQSPFGLGFTLSTVNTAGSTIEVLQSSATDGADEDGPASLPHIF